MTGCEQRRQPFVDGQIDPQENDRRKMATEVQAKARREGQTTVDLTDLGRAEADSKGKSRARKADWW